MTKSTRNSSRSADNIWMPLVDAATTYEVGFDDQWGSLTVEFPSSVDLSELRALCQRHSYGAVAVFGEYEDHLTLTEDTLSREQLNAISDLAISAEDQVAVAAMDDGWQVVARMAHHLRFIRVRHSRRNWCHSIERFEELVANDWLDVADNLSEDPILVGGCKLLLDLAANSEPGILVPSVPEDPSDEDAIRLAMQLLQLADLAAWRNIALAEVRHDGQLLLALCQDQPPEVRVNLEDVVGGLDLWRWLTSDEDANRNEALRYVLRFQTSISRQLPRARDVKTLAERHRMALARENAAEVYRAIEESERRTADALLDAKRRLSQYVEETTKVFQGTVVAATGLAVLIVRTEGTVPDWLLWMVAMAAVSGLALLGWSRCSSVGELVRDVISLGNSLAANPLLPSEESQQLRDEISGSDTVGRKKRVQLIVGALGVFSACIIVATVCWLTLRGHAVATGESPSTPESEDAWCVVTETALEGCYLRQA